MGKNHYCEVLSTLRKTPIGIFTAILLEIYSFSKYLSVYCDRSVQTLGM